ncbi:translational GTPase TypA, partial [Klebsiella pneumoniae]|nr:translational GTPase TypA [Klebsiella pneumoniae]
IINSIFAEYKPDFDNWRDRDQGSLVAFENGVATQYALTSAQDRGVLFIGPGAEVYKGEVIGQNSRAEDVIVNVCKEKQLTNNRSKGDGV